EVTVLASASGTTSADHVLTTLTTLAAANRSAQSFANAQIAAIAVGPLTNHALSLLTNLGVGATDAMQHAVLQEVPALLAAAHVTGHTALITLLNLYNVPGGTPAMQGFVGTEIAAAVAANVLSPQQAVNDL